MESIIRDVSALDEGQRRALEAVLGRELRANQRLVICIMERTSAERIGTAADRQAQTVEEWTRVYEGLGDEQIAGIDGIAKTRATFAR
jgi:hypothetical protein